MADQNQISADGVTVELIDGVTVIRGLPPGHVLVREYEERDGEAVLVRSFVKPADAQR